MLIPPWQAAVIKVISQQNKKILPLFHAMAGFGAPETSHRKTAANPSVTVVSAGGRVNVGAMSGTKHILGRGHRIRSLEPDLSTPGALFYPFLSNWQPTTGDDNHRNIFRRDRNLSLFITGILLLKLGLLAQ